MTYGQTSAGKTYTLFGEGEEKMGLVPRFGIEMFRRLKEIESCESVKIIVKASFFEIYKEKIYDLMNEQENVSLNIRENLEKGVFIENLTEVKFNSADELVEKINFALSKRKVNETSMNARSSRSHLVSSLEIEIKTQLECSNNKKNKNDEYEITKRSKMIFIDLAGSEKQGQNVDNVLLEGCYINKSLSVLQHVLSAIGKKQSQEYVHYRDSKFNN